MNKQIISVCVFFASVLTALAAFALRPMATVRYVRNHAGTGYERISAADFNNPLIGQCIAATNTYCSYTGSDTQLTQISYTTNQFRTLVSQGKAHGVGQGMYFEYL